MSEKLTGEALCRAIMLDLVRCIHVTATAHVGYLRHGPKTPVDEHAGRHMLALTSAGLTSDQLDALEAALCQIQEETIGAFLSLLDGDRQPAGFPEQIRLVNMDTGEVVCAGGLQWAFGAACLDWKRQRCGNGGKEQGAE